MESELAIRENALATKADLLATKTDLQADFHGLELKLEALRGETRTEFQALRAELKGDIQGSIRWNFAFWVTQLAAMAAILKLLR
jgi:hypothetical protein